ncbi:hypothetical protein [Ralstonia pseudosolanacearum]|uniref:hypothetical protein n=1 Tax=Ralstonia pseudosolanacearum TaxID=1310165 RepID=UPI003CEF9FF2
MISQHASLAANVAAALVANETLARAASTNPAVSVHAENDGSEPVLFPIKRTLDYSVIQNFLVAAEDVESAKEKVAEFVDSDWTPQSARLYGVALISNVTYQREESQDIEKDGGLVPVSAAAIKESVSDVVIEGRAGEMFALLVKIAERHQMYHANVADLGMEVKTFIDTVQAEIAQNQQTLVEVTAQALSPDDVSED